MRKGACGGRDDNVKIEEGKEALGTRIALNFCLGRLAVEYIR